MNDPRAAVESAQPIVSALRAQHPVAAKSAPGNSGGIDSY